MYVPYQKYDEQKGLATYFVNNVAAWVVNVVLIPLEVLLVYFILSWLSSGLSRWWDNMTTIFSGWLV